jgi:threonine dehydratase
MANPKSGPIELDALALVRDVRPPTPLQPAPELAENEGLLLLKREDQGPNGSFKWRGALCMCAALQAAGADAVVTASTGNHGAATAWAAARLGMGAHVVVPEIAGRTKCQMIEALGAKLHHAGAAMGESVEAGLALAEELGVPYFEDGASEPQLCGAETVGVELVDAKPNVVIVPLACGVLAGGLGRALARHAASARIIGVQSAAYDSVRRRLVGLPDRDDDDGPSVTIADGLADDRIVEPAFSTCREHVDEVVAVDDEAIVQALLEIWNRLGLVVEGAAAAPLAALRKWPELAGERTVLIVSGRNLDERWLNRITGT